MITGIGHPCIRVRNFEASIKFYTEVLGLKLAFEIYKPDGVLGGVYLYIAPSQFIEIFPGGENKCAITPETIGYLHICYEVSDIDSAYDEMRAKGAPIDVALKDGISKCKMFFTHDPDGNIIEIMELVPGSLQAQANKKLESQE